MLTHATATRVKSKTKAGKQGCQEQNYSPNTATVTYVLTADAITVQF